MNDTTNTNKNTKKKNRKVFKSIKRNPLILEFSNFPLFPPIFSFDKKENKKNKQNKIKTKLKRN